MTVNYFFFQDNPECNDITSTIAFSGIRNLDSTISTGNYISYNTATINTNGVLDLGSGLFTVPRGGHGKYSFSFVCSGRRTKSIHIVVEKNGLEKFRITDGDDQNVEGANVSYYWLEDLQDGDTIRLQVYDWSIRDSLHSNPNNPVIFNGFRLS